MIESDPDPRLTSDQQIRADIVNTAIELVDLMKLAIQRKIKIEKSFHTAFVNLLHEIE